MGFLYSRHGMTLFGRTPDGACPECASVHDPGQPHNRDSLTYQYKFYDQYGRYPTWADAMAHCTKEVKELWVQALGEKGIEV